MRANLKQHKQSFKDLTELLEKIKLKCEKEESNVDLSPFNINLDLKIVKKDEKKLIPENDYNIFIGLFFESINIKLSIEEFHQRKIKINGEDWVDLENLKDEYSSMNDGVTEDEISLRKINNEDFKYLDKKTFFDNKENKEEWNVKIIDSIINNIFNKENESKTTEIYKPKKKRSKKSDLSSRPFVCHHKNCSSAFKRFEHLKRHYRIHIGERPFKCKYPGCFKKFARSDNLSQHIKIHNTGQNSYSNDSMSLYDDKF